MTLNHSTSYLIRIIISPWIVCFVYSHIQTIQGEIVEITERDGDPTCLFNVLISIKVPSEINGIYIESAKKLTNYDSPLQSFDNYSCVVGALLFNSPSVLMYEFNRVATVFNKALISKNRFVLWSITIKI